MHLYAWRHGHPYIHCRIFQLPVWTSARYKAVFLPSAGPHCWSFLHTTAWLILQQSRVTWPHERATPAKQTQELLLAAENNTIQTQMSTVHSGDGACLTCSVNWEQAPFFPVVCDHMVAGFNWATKQNRSLKQTCEKSITGKESFHFHSLGISHA